MEKDKTQDIYNEITNELKDEKMNWDFEDFLEKTKEEDKIIPLVSKTKGGSIPKTFWMAASVILLISVGIFFNYEKENATQQDSFTQNELVKSKENFELEPNSNLTSSIVADTIKVKTEKVRTDSVLSTDQSKEIDILEQIMPKRGRINRNSRQRYVEVSPTKKIKENTIQTLDYESNYVIINGQKIENEQEAIDLTKHSFRILSDNVYKTIAQTNLIHTFNND